MSLFYNTLTANPSGVLYIQNIEPPRDGSRIKLELPGNRLFTSEVYLAIDGDINYTPYKNLARVDNSISGLAALFRGAHQASAIIVSKQSFTLTPRSIAISPIPVTLSASGERVCINLSASYSVNAKVADTKGLLKEYVDGNFSTPEDAINDIVEDTVRTEINRVVTEHFVGNYSSFDLNQLSEEITDNVTRKVNSGGNWFRVSCKLQLTSSNIDAIINKENEPYRMRVEMAKMAAEAMIEVYKTSAGIPSEMREIVVAILNTCPGITKEELIATTAQLKTLCDKSSPEFIVQAAKKYGLPVGGGKITIP